MNENPDRIAGFQAEIESMKVKAAGGMHSWQEALAMVDAGASRLGTSSTLKILEGAEE